jgi:type I restriction enzyme S subunit
VSFLEYETTKIDELVAEQQNLIELLKEKRQAVISHAVTKGLVLTDKMKDSGVMWVGDVPEHWEIKKIKWCLKLKNEKTQERSNTIALENVEGWTGRFIDTESEFEGDGVKFNEGDVLFGKLRPYLAKVFRATMSGEAIGDFFVLQPKHNLLPQFAERLLISSEFIDAINSSTYGTKMPRVNWEYFSSMLIPLPPVHEQIQISNYLVTAIKEMDDLIAISNNAVALFQERRSALISSAVTGQIDVRGSHGN